MSARAWQELARAAEEAWSQRAPEPTPDDLLTAEEKLSLLAEDSDDDDM